MILINDPYDAPTGQKIVAIGSFDGVHLGHQYLLRRALREAKRRGLPLLVYTFDPPTKVFVKGVGMLSSMSEKVDLLRELGVEIALVVPFNEAFASRSKDEFLEDLRALEACAIYVGEDFGFGRGRSGTPQDLQAVAPTVTVPLLELGGSPVKSTRIRALLEAGRVEEAKHLLGRPYSARGVVAGGDQLGRTLGFPTANLRVPSFKVLPPGVYAVRVTGPHGTHGGMANVGTRPTVNGRALRLEVHLFGFTGNLYGEELEVAFLKKLRSEQRFESLEALKAQLVRDAEAARRYLGL